METHDALFFFIHDSSGNEGVGDVHSGNVSSFLCIDGCSEEDGLESGCGGQSISLVDGNSLFVSSRNHTAFDGIVTFLLEEEV